MLSDVFELHQMLVIYLKIAKICIINFEWSEKKKKGKYAQYGDDNNNYCGSFQNNQYNFEHLELDLEGREKGLYNI